MKRKPVDTSIGNTDVALSKAAGAIKTICGDSVLSCLLFGIFRSAREGSSEGNWVERM